MLILSIGYFKNNIYSDKKREKFIYKLNNVKRLTKSKRQSLGSHGYQQLLFSLVRLILCYAGK